MKYVYIIMLAMSFALFVMMGTDKRAAKMGMRRIPEKRLFAFAVFGGAIGGTLGMFAFRHKTKHWYFRIGFPVLAALQIAGAAYITLML